MPALDRNARIRQRNREVALDRGRLRPRDAPQVHHRAREQLEAALTPRTKALVFVSPSNPTGAVYPADQVEAIGRAYLEFARELPHYFDACARYQAHAGADGTPHPNECACMGAGHRVHEVIVDSLGRGVADGSIRADVGDLYVTALALWAFSHGLIQIASTKVGQMAHQGIPVQTFVDHAFAMALRTLQP